MKSCPAHGNAIVRAWNNRRLHLEGARMHSCHDLHCETPNRSVPLEVEGRWPCVENNRRSSGVPSRRREFDQFLLEEVMLPRWVSLARLHPPCEARGRGRSECVAVVQSPIFRIRPCAGFHKNTNFLWDTALHEYATQAFYLSYWRNVTRKHCVRLPRPHPSGLVWDLVCPTLVVHFPFVFDLPERSQRFLTSLFQQPFEFRSRVIIAGIEANLPLNLTRALLPERILGLDDLLRGEQRRHPSLLSLPYPTWSPFGWRGFKGERQTLLADWDSSSMNSLAAVAFNLGRAAVPSLRRSKTPVRAALTALAHTYPEWEPRNLSHTFSQRLLSAKYCLEPAGDSPTRSHFYAAILSGCVPVLVEDRNMPHAIYGHAAAAWAWRTKDGHSLRCNSMVINYSRLSVLLDHVPTSETIGATELLLQREYNQRAAELRQVAPAFGYAPEPRQDERKNRFDAFSLFSTLVLRSHLNQPSMPLPSNIAC
uniref:Exostosin GT47 domain-containing protein n=2 Tax=Calcidiscus leptoporus TaxID=127549 RepID=A0A7S0P5X9_9EUKA